MDLGVSQVEPHEGTEADEFPKNSPLRRCIVTREPLEKTQMIRFVLDPDGQVVPDLKGTLPGRGLWVKAEAKMVAEAVKRNAFAKAAKTSVKAPKDLADQVGFLLKRQVCDLIGLAKRGGMLVSGFEKVERRLRAGNVALLIEASDAAADGRAKLARLAGSGVEIWTPLTGVELAQALGRETAIHVAVTPGGFATKLQAALQRQAGFAGDRRPS
jgi:predicted RNA-binding protein YlxR (DUF448 family)/ribosomal protein L7Ae-like RNA K-turn-binding protein